MAFSTYHIDYLDRTSFYNEQDTVNLSQTNWLSPNPQSLHSLQIITLPRFSNTDNDNPTDINPIGDILAGIHGTQQSLIYAIIGKTNQINLQIATCSHQSQSNLNSNHSPLDALLKSAYAGIELTPIDSSWQNFLLSLPHVAIMTGTPFLKRNNTPNQDQQIDRLIRGLYGTNWAYVTIAKPLSFEEFDPFSYNTLQELRNIVNNEKSAGGVNIDPYADKYKQLVNRFWRKVQIGKSQGMWHTITYLLTQDTITLNRAKGIAKAVFSGSSGGIDPIRLITTDNINSPISNFSLPITPPSPTPQGKIKYTYQYLSLLNSSELAAMVHFPTQEMSGYFIRPQAQFDVTPHHTNNEGITLGEIVNQGNKTGVDYKINPETLTKHSLIVGTTGSGKTNTIFHLLRQLANLNIPFLVIEPAKTEYRALLEANELKDKLRIFTLGKETISPFRLNPFQILPNVSVQSHIDHLKSVFNASFAMYAPMPHVLEQCIHEIYEDKGWDLVTSENQRSLTLPVHDRSHPTLTDLYNKIEEVVNRLGYGDEIRMNVKAALKTRINSLRIGGKGLMLDTPTSLDIKIILEAPTILELDHVGDDDEKAFLIGLILMSLSEYYRSKGQTEETGLNHITVVEEAHRLLKNTVSTVDVETANMAGKAVEFFSNLLAEIRAYGERLVVAEQIPSKLASDIIKNTNLKIVHRMMAAEDRELIGGAMCLKEDQSQWLASCETGESAIFSEGDDSALRMQVPYRKIQQTFTGINSDEKVKQSMSYFQTDNQTKWCFNPYPWSQLDANIRQQYHREARRLVDNSEFQEAFARYIISIVILGELLPNELRNIGQIIAKNSRQGNINGLQETVLTYGIDWLLETRARQNNVSYEKLPKLKRFLSQLILNQGASSDELEVFQTEYQELFTCKTQPFIGCDRICGNNGCLYRHHVAPLVNDTRLYSNFSHALAKFSGEELYEQLFTHIFQSLRRRLPIQKIPDKERKEAAFCLLLQLANRMSTLDRYLIEEKLLSGLGLL